MPLLVHAVARTLAVHREAVKLARETDSEVGDIDHLLYFAFSFGENLARLERDQRAEVVFGAAQLVPQLARDLATFRRGQQTPALKRMRRPPQNLIVVFLGRQQHPAQLASIAGIVRSDLAAGRLFDPITRRGTGVHGGHTQTSHYLARSGLAIRDVGKKLRHDAKRENPRGPIAKPRPDTRAARSMRSTMAS